jgi:hypothetical protein
VTDTSPNPPGRPTVLLDTSHLGQLSSDAHSKAREKRRAAQQFVSALANRGWLILLTFHQVLELLQHRDDSIVDDRLDLMWSLAEIAWVHPVNQPDGPATVADVLAYEVRAAFTNPEADVHSVRNLVRERMIRIGRGTDAVPRCQFEGWRQLRPVLEEQQRRAMRTAALAPKRAFGGLNVKMREWMNGQWQRPEEVGRLLLTLRESLSQEIAQKGDKRIADPAAMADEFVDELRETGSRLQSTHNDVPPAVALLGEFGIGPEDIDPSASLGEMLDLVVFRQRLQIAGDSCGLPWTELKAVVTADRLPSDLISTGMREHAQDNKRREGGDVTDAHLLCFAPYATATFVDKRTKENVNRLRRQSPLLRTLLGNVEKVSRYTEILDLLDTVSNR